MIENKKITSKDMPLAIIESPHSTIGNSVIAANDSNWPEIATALGKDNHGDAVQLEGHIRSGRDVFVTDDRDFLDRRDKLQEKFGVIVKSTDELVAMLDPPSA